MNQSYQQKFNRAPFQPQLNSNGPNDSKRCSAGPIRAKIKPICLLMAFVFSSQLQANEWLVDEGNWFDEANWQLGVPDALDAAFDRPFLALITNGGTARITNGDAISG